MSWWKVRIFPAAEHDLEQIDDGIRETIYQQILDLEDDPFPPGHLRIRNSKRHYRIRAEGDYRVIYRVPPDRGEVMILRVRHRGVVYQGFERR